MLYIGAKETFTATMTMSDNSTKPITGGVWGSDASGVAIVVPATGEVTILSSGMAHIFVDYQGLQGSKLIRGLPNYQGVWSGIYFVDSCSASLSWSSTGCNEFPVNKSYPIGFDLTQNRDRVQSTIHMGAISGETSGTIDKNGALPLTYLLSAPPWSIDAWSTIISVTPGQATGYISLTFQASGYTGAIRVETTIRYLNRTSSIAGTSFGCYTAQTSGPTIHDLIRLLAGR